MTQMFRAAFLAEVRTARRLTRTWLLGGLAVLTTLVGYLYFAALHAEMSSFIPSAVTSPRFLVSSFGGYLLWFLMAATVFLGLDIGSRERRERIADVLDTRPITNLQWLGGRSAGVIATLAVPVAVTVAVIQGVGTLGQWLDWPVREGVEPVSLVVFLGVDAFPTLVLWIAIVFLLAAVLRGRLAVALVAFAMLGLAMWSLSLAPAWLLDYVALAPDRLVSDLVSPVPDTATFVLRISLLAGAAGVLVLAALCLPRPDAQSPRRYVVAAMVLLGSSAAGIAAVVIQAHAELDQRARWQTARESVPGNRVDVVSVTGDVHIDPGKALRIDVSLTAAWPGRAARPPVLRFNPGMAVREVVIGDRAVGFEHRDGVLRVDQSGGVGDRVTLSVRADGIPDPDFAYLDSAIDYRTVVGANPLRGLGTEASLFDRRYVALMPDVHWLPGISASARDIAHVDLEVRLPAGWLVAGPGRRENLGAGRYRFSSEVPATQVALLASKFERIATTIDDLELELLLHPRHTGPARYFEVDAAAITDAVASILEEAQVLGIPYPYETLRMVEVPARLRGYGGGWQMQTVLALPGMLLLRERGFPTARFFDSFFDSAVPTQSPTARLDRLRMFLKEDRTGADPFAGLARNLFLYQTGARGTAATALEYVCHALTARLLDDAESYFSAHIYASSPSVLTLLADAFTSVFTGGSGSASGEVFAPVRPPSVWERALGTALSDVDNLAPAQAVNTLTMKGDAVARAILDAWGRETAARLVAELRNRHRGASFTAADFEQAAAAVGADLAGVLGDWLHDASLPGFVASAVTTERLGDGADGEPRYQLRVHVFNGENAPGLLRLRYRTANRDAPIGESEPVRVAGRSATEVGLVTREPIQELWVAPYLSLNRHEFPLRVPETDASGVVKAPPFVGARPSPWRPATGSGIVVDDLDPGFHAPVPRDSSLNYDIDQGLPVYQRLDPVLESHWSRQEQPTSWGRYRHTIVRVTPGDGDRAATFSTVLPESGRWRIDFHLPDLAARYSARIRSPFTLTANVEFNSQGSDAKPLGRYDLKLLSRGVERAVEFDASAAEPGWTTLGRYDLAAGRTSLVVSNRTDGRTVVADAVRWVRDAPDAN